MPKSCEVCESGMKIRSLSKWLAVSFGKITCKKNFRSTKLVGFSHASLSFVEIFAFIDKPPRKCLLRRNFCDGKAHCNDGTDERASGFGFKCRMNSSVTVAESCVLPQFMIDDGVVDCTEALDECRADGRERQERPQSVLFQFSLCKKMHESVQYCGVVAAVCSLEDLPFRSCLQDLVRLTFSGVTRGWGKECKLPAPWRAKCKHRISF